MDADIAGGTTPGLRERKRLRTRRSISDAALRLFVEHGFENVTLAEIAAAADVAPATVFTHFSCKEEIFFSRRDEFDAGLAEIVQGAHTTDELLAALRGWAMRNIDSVLTPDSLDRSRDYAHILMDSPVLQRKRAGLARERQQVIGEALLVWCGDEADNLDVLMFAAMVSAVVATLFEVLAVNLVRDQPVSAIYAHIVEGADSGFGALARAYSGTDMLGRP
jgi:AcrR family transcriptional regulator